MKTRLIEQLNQIHRLMKIINELNEADEIKDKADLVTADVNEFFKNIENVDTPLFQEKLGSMKYKKSVESIQMGLILLGYPLPKFGIDGLFGPETAQAVNKFKTDNDIRENIEEGILLHEVTLNSPIPFQGVTSDFGKQRTTGKHPGVDLKAKSGTEIKSPLPGKVIDARFKEGACGGTIQVQHSNGFTSRYCHCKEIKVNIGQEVSQGEILGLSGGASGDKGAGRSTGPHLHFELKKDGKLVDPIDYLNKETDGVVNSNENNFNKAVITDDFIDVMLKKLKQIGVNSEELAKLITTSNKLGTSLSMTGDWLDITKTLLKKYEGFSDKAKWDENSFRGGYGSDKKIINGILTKANRNTTWTKEEAEQTLNYEIKNTYAPIIVKQLGIENWNKLNDKQKASLVSLGYNTGPYFLTAKGFGKEIKNAIESGDMEKAAKYIENGPITGSNSGRVYSGLQRRRKEEAQLFMT